MELAPTPKVHAPQVYFEFITEILLCSSLETRILVLSTFTRKPCDSSEVFQAPSLFLKSKRESLETARLLEFSNDHAQLALNSLHETSISIMSNKRLSKDP